MPLSYQQGYDAQAKQSTRYVANGANVAACITDRSQRLLNMTAGVGCAFEATSTRFNYGHPRTILLRLQANNTDTEILWSHGSAGTLERLRFSAANTITVTVAGAVVLTYTVTGLGAGRENLVIAWVSQANPDTTGASDAVLSWLMLWNTTDGTFDKVRFTHAIKASVSATAFWGAGSTLGVQAFSGVITDVLYENRTMSATEIANDWVSAISAPSSDVVTDLQGIPPQSVTIDGQNFHHGPAAAWVCDATRRLERRTLQWLRNLPMRIRPSWTAALLEATPDPFIRGAPGASSERMHLAWLEPAPVPDNCDRLWARVHIRSWTTSGSAVPIRVRIYSFSKPPGVLELAGNPGDEDPLEKYYGQATITRDDDASVGEWTVLSGADGIPIARGKQGVDEGITYLVLALQVDPSSSSSNDVNARIAVNAIQVVPFFREDGLPLPVSP